VLAPAPIAVALLLVVAWRSAASGLAAAVWSAVAIAFVALVPVAYVVRGVRRGRLSDRHIRVRQQRPVPLLVAIGSVSLGAALLAVGGAPADLVALVGAMLAGLVAVTVVTLLWKVSGHAAVAAGAVVILVLLFGPALLLLLPLAVLVGWARTASGDHSPAQVIAGALLGGAVTALVFPLLR
jgi:membrane-associated phospholipid phosphatase